MKVLCPYPATCVYAEGEAGEFRCRRGNCPFRIHLRRMVAGEIQRLSQKGKLTPAQSRELEAFKGEYARLLRGGGVHDQQTASPQSPGDGAGG